MIAHSVGIHMPPMCCDRELCPAHMRNYTAMPQFNQHTDNQLVSTVAHHNHRNDHSHGELLTHMCVVEIDGTNGMPMRNLRTRCQTHNPPTHHVVNEIVQRGVATEFVCNLMDTKCLVTDHGWLAGGVGCWYAMCVLWLWCYWVSGSEPFGLSPFVSPNEWVVPLNVGTTHCTSTTEEHNATLTFFQVSVSFPLWRYYCVFSYIVVL